MTKRKTISKKLRFEVFKRDNFTCQYCGRSAPEAILEVDHINPVANGGDNDIMNLITSCRDCNRGKGKKKLTEQDEIKKQQKQLEEINERRKQLEMMLEWKEELLKFDDEQVEKIEELYSKTTDANFTEVGKEKVKKWIKEFGFEEVYESTEISVTQYEDKVKAFNYIPRICSTRKQQRENPLIASINKITYLAKSRCDYFCDYKLKQFLKKHMAEEDVDSLLDIASSVRNWTDCRKKFEEYFDVEGEI